MKAFRALVDIRPALPDDRLYMVEVTPNTITNVFRAGFLDEEARRDMEEYMRHITRYEQWMKDDDGSPHFTGGTYRYANGGGAAESGSLEIHMDRVPSNILGLQTCAPLFLSDSFIW